MRSLEHRFTSVDILDRAKSDGIQFRLPAPYARALWPTVRQSFDNILVSGLNYPPDIVTRVIPKFDEGLSFVTAVQQGSIVTVETSIHTAYDKATKKGFIYQFIGKIHFSGTSPDTGVRRVTRNPDMLLSAVQKKGITAYLNPSAGIPCEIHFGNNGNTDMIFFPGKTSSSCTYGGFGVAMGPMRTGSPESLVFKFEKDMPRFLRGLGYLVDTFIEMDGLKAPTKILRFNQVKT